jgi:DNA-binding SARP family transcriptional activator
VLNSSPQATGEGAAQNPSLEIFLLGPFRVSVGGAPVADCDWQRRKPKALVKLLALQPQHRLHREQVIEHLLPGLDPEAAAKNLNKIIYLARRALEPGLKSGGESRFILTREQQVALGAPGGLWLDHEVFAERARAAVRGGDAAAGEEALALYGGDLLPEDLYEEWVARRREELRALYHELLLALAGHYENRGDDAKAVERLRSLLAADAAHEEAHRQLMRLYARAGHRHQALQQYQACREALRRELDAEPEAETVRLAEQIARGQLSAGTADGPAPPAALPAPLPAAPPATPSVALPPVATPPPAVLNAAPDGEPAPPADLAPATPAPPAAKKLYWRSVAAAAVVLALTGGTAWLLTRQGRPVEATAAREKGEAYQLYLKGRNYWGKRTTGSYKKAVAHFEQAIERDPTYAPAYAGLADTYILLARADFLPPREAFPKAKAAAQRALEFDSQLPEASTSLAQIKFHYDWDWEGAEREFKRALALKPDDAAAWQWYARLLLVGGREAESLAASRRAVELSPLDMGLAGQWGLYYRRQFEQVIADNRRYLKLHPEYANAHLRLGKAYLQTGRYREAVEEFEQSLRLDDRGGTRAWLGYAHAVAGNRDEARRVLAELTARALQDYVAPYSFALVHTGLGDRDQAFAWLERAFAGRDEEMVWLRHEPALDSLRADARFADLVRRVGLTP